jgi:hypothetical protein
MITRPIAKPNAATDAITVKVAILKLLEGKIRS